MIQNMTHYRYEVTTANTEQELNRNGGQLKIHKTLKDAKLYASEQAKKHPYVYVEKVYMDEQGDFVDFEFIWAHNPNNW